jgi:hypothetical protein
MTNSAVSLLPDSYPITLPAADFTPDNTTLYFDDAEGLYRFYAEFTGNSERALEVANHELDHYDVALAVGISALKFCVQITEDNGQRYVQPSVEIGGTTITKLELAAFHGAPTHPSEQDLLALLLLGYTIDTLGRSIESRNEETDKPPILLPRSYNPVR